MVLFVKVPLCMNFQNSFNARKKPKNKNIRLHSSVLLLRSCVATCERSSSQDFYGMCVCIVCALELKQSRWRLTVVVVAKAKVSSQ